MQLVGRATRRPGAEPRHRAGDLLEIPPQVLPAHRLLGRPHRPGPEHHHRRLGEGHHRGVLVVDRGHALGVSHRGLHAVGRHHRLDDLGEDRLDDLPQLGVQHPQRADRLPLRGDDVGGRAGAHDPPHEHRRGAGVEPAGQRRRHLGDHLGEGIRDVLGQVRPRGMSAAPGDDDVDLVGGRRDRPDAQADGAHVDRGVAVHGEHAVDIDERSLLHDAQGAAGVGLLGGLEDEADRGPARHELLRERLQREPGAEQTDGMHVVAARVAGARVLGGEGQPGDLLDRQRVQIGAQPDRHLGVGVPDVDEGTGPGQRAHPCPRLRQDARDELGGAPLLPADLGVAVDVATPGLQLWPAGVDLLLDPAQHLGEAARDGCGGLAQGARGVGLQRLSPGGDAVNSSGYAEGGGPRHPPAPRCRPRDFAPRRDFPWSKSSKRGGVSGSRRRRHRRGRVRHTRHRCRAAPGRHPPPSAPRRPPRS